nr:YdeI/OmpD-associated family protein [Clostridium cuniculi]
MDNNIKEFWNTLSFSMQKKYVTWITSAKKEDTRNKRIDTAIEKLKNKEKIK